MIPFYSFSNENLDAIVNALSPKSGDNILAVGGSGDQAFALLSSGAKVTVIDNDPEQLSYIQQRINYLVCERFLQFLNPHGAEIYNMSLVLGWTKKRRDSFFSKERISKIASNLDNLSFSPSGDLFDFLKINGDFFNLVYCSNVLEYGNKDYFTSLKNISSSLKSGACCYVSSERDFFDCESPSVYKLEIDVEKTKTARLFEPNWFPLIYRKPQLK